MYVRKPLPILVATEAVALVASGALAGLAFASKLYGFLLWFLLAPLFAVLWWRPVHPWRGMLVGGIWGVSFYLTSYWFMTYLHPLTWRGLGMVESLIVAYGLAWFLLSVVSGAGIALWGTLLGWLRPQGWGRIWVPAAAWVLWEWVQRLGPLAMPWNVLAISQTAYPAVLQISAIGGSVAVAGLIVAVNAGLGCLIVDLPRLGMGAWRYVAVPLSLAGINAMGGAWYLAGQPTKDAGQLEIGIVQGNVRPDVKWQPNALREMWATYQRLTKSLTSRGVSLVVWPETAMPVILSKAPALTKELQTLASTSHTSLLVGTLDRPIGSRGPYNAACLVTPAGQVGSWYYKRHLVPFGEFMPGGDALRTLLPQLNALPDDVQPGQSPNLIAFGGLRLGPMICYESIFPDLARDSVRAGADVLVVITNDAWYKQSIALYQHLGQAVLRAVETRRPVIRAANTGISAVIDPFGRIQGQTTIDQTTTLTGRITPQTGETPYVRWGDWLVAGAATFLGLYALTLSTRRK